MKKVIISFTILLLLFVNFNNVVLADNVVVQTMPFFKFYYNSSTSNMSISNSGSKSLIAIPNPLEDFDFNDNILPAFNFSDFPQYQYFCYRYYDQTIGGNQRRWVNVYFNDEPFVVNKLTSTDFSIGFDLGYSCDITKNTDWWSGWNVIGNGSSGAASSFVTSSYSEYFSFNSSFIYNNTVYDGNVGNNDSRIKIDYHYAEDKKSCHVNATIQNGQFTDRLYYSNNLPNFSGELVDKKSFPSSGLDLTYNQSLFLQAEDSQGNIIGTNSISINQIVSMSTDMLDVTLDFSESGKLVFTPRLKNQLNVYNNILVQIDNVSENVTLNVCKDDDLLNWNVAYDFVNGGKVIGQGESYRVWGSNGFVDLEITFDLVFDVKDKVTGQRLLYKKYNVVLQDGNKTGIIPGDSYSPGGEVIDSDGGSRPLTPDNDDNISLPGGNNFNYSWDDPIGSTTAFIDMSKDYFNFIGMVFTFLPVWITGPLTMMLVLLVIITVKKAIWG